MIKGLVSARFGGRPFAILRATIAVEALNVSSRDQRRNRNQRFSFNPLFDCLCAKGKGTCTIQNNTGALACHKGPADTCKTDCFLSIDIGGLLGSPQN